MRPKIAVATASVIEADQLLWVKNPAAHDIMPTLRSVKNNTNTAATADNKILTTNPASIKISGLNRLGVASKNTKLMLSKAPTNATKNPP